MARHFYGSINISELLELAQKKHSAFKKAESNKKLYAGVSIWLNDEPDQYGNILSIKLSCDKEKKDTEGKNFIGNAKESETDRPITSGDAAAIAATASELEKSIADDLPF